MKVYYKKIEGTHRYILEKPIVWDIGFKGNDKKEVVPAGFVFDVSVPWVARWLFNRNNPRYFIAAALHDHLLNIGYDRVSAAGAFNHGLLARKVPYIARLVMTLGVAFFKFR
jgi:hypothetical protein|tara:strand:- start:343 stop:678 length:336 start_codon:yes stop_codon:yes gene_type:complete